MLAELDLPIDLTTRGGVVTIRRAAAEDLHRIMQLLSDDPISAGRGDINDDADESAYGDALARIIASDSNEIVLAEDGHGSLVGTLQLTVIPGMARRGSTRLLVEAVRVVSGQRSTGIGTALMRWAMDVAAPATGASLVQLTSDAARPDAHRFYERLGFADSHIGFKYRLEPRAVGDR